MVSPCFQVPILHELKTKQSKIDEVDTQYDIIKVEEYKKAKTICTSHCTPLIEVTHLRTQ